MGTITAIYYTILCSIFVRYEFAPNEFINAIEFVTLETQSNETGFKEFLAVATTIDRGEDLAVKGAVRLFRSVACLSTDDGLDIHF